MRRAAIVLALGLMGVADGRAQDGCDPSYPTVCIPSPPPDLDCGEIEHRDFEVRGSDPHRFDRDRDGIGCESLAPPAEREPVS
jgi:micrococcal nuclease